MCIADVCIFTHTGCMVHVRDSVHNKAPIVILDDLEKVNITQLFGDLLDPIEYRGKTYSFRIKGNHRLTS